MKITKTFIASTSKAMDVVFGFEPDEIHALADCAGTGPIEYWWYKGVYYSVVNNTALWTAAIGRYGFSRAQANGAMTYCNGADNGFIPYDTKVSGVKIPSPAGKTTTNPDGYAKVPAGAAAAAAATISDWDTDVNYNTTGQDRSALVVGTCVRPPVHNNRVYELTTGYSATGGDEVVADWDVAIGQSVTDCNGNIWLCREEILCIIGGAGITIGSGIAANGKEWVITAETHDDVIDSGDADLLNPI